jgi:hypothetical protein
MRHWMLGWLLLAAGAATAAGVYKWVDAEGRVHFGDRPPDLGATAVEVPNTPVAPSVPDAAGARDQQERLLRAYAAERQERREREAKSRAEAEQRARNCAQARDRLRQYESAGYLYRLDPAGERVIVSDAEREQSTAEARAAVAQWCD